ncbi:YokU family protein [Mesobacillus zeae]|uniref:YokU family protein n=1 Tax=Mesobacillus zeae TaxID=1917180 RepID=A0A398B949_9BACI|nr:YokU family protein [Mesobacillus zeae]RID84216.1 YokU family protein [Mesobacillus zeae]
MEFICEWCGKAADKSLDTVYWELPDGSRAIEITDTPAVSCKDCGMVYQTEEVTKEIEDQLFLIDTKPIGKIISFEDLMARPRLLKRNYFDFSS